MIFHQMMYFGAEFFNFSRRISPCFDDYNNDTGGNSEVSAYRNRESLRQRLAHHLR